MRLWFWGLAALFHAGLLTVCVVRARKWIHRDVASLGGVAFWRSILMDALWCGLVAVPLGLALAALLPDPGFAAIRFGAQALFGEALLYLFFLSFLHWRKGLPRRSALLALAALVLLAVYVDAYHVEPERIQIEEHRVDLTEGLGPGHLRSIRLLHVSDIQTPTVGAYERRVVRLAAELEPDLVVLTGDYIHERLRPTGRQAGRDLADLLDRHGPRPPLGTWAVGGDVDGAEIEQQLKGSGIGWLEDEIRAIPLPGGPPLTLIGLGPGTSRGKRPATVWHLLSNAPEESPRIVFGHSPDYVLDLLDGPPVALALAGHTHGGQIVVPFFGPPMTLSRVPRSVAAGGLHDLGRVPVHVSRGVGMERASAPQIRFFCPPEICILTLRY